METIYVHELESFDEIAGTEFKLESVKTFYDVEGFGGFTVDIYETGHYIITRMFDEYGNDIKFEQIVSWDGTIIIDILTGDSYQRYIMNVVEDDQIEMYSITDNHIDKGYPFVFLAESAYHQYKVS